MPAPAVAVRPVRAVLRPARCRLGAPLLASLLVAAGVVAGAAAPAVAWPVDRSEVRVSETGGLSPATVEAVGQVARFVGAEATVIHSGMVRLMSVSRGGADVQRPAPGFGYPMTFAALDPVGAGPLLGEDLAAILAEGALVMSEFSAGLRGAAVGDVVEIEGWNGSVRALTIGAILPDDQLDWYEIMLSTEVAGALGIDRPARAALWDAADQQVVATFLQALVPGNEPVSVRAPGEPPDVRDAPLPTVLVKQRFGEFAFRMTGGDGIEVEDAWVEENIVWVDLPRLGPFRCHRAVVPYVRSAMAALEEAGLGSLIDTTDFQQAGGCYNARLMRGGDKGFALSRHAWGIAVDINPTANPYGGPVSLDPALAAVFQAWGFAWGGGWRFPDGMHFEWARFPDAVEHACSSHMLVRSALTDGGWEVYARVERCAVS